MYAEPMGMKIEKHSRKLHETHTVNLHISSWSKNKTTREYNRI